MDVSLAIAIALFGFAVGYALGVMLSGRADAETLTKTFDDGWNAGLAVGLKEPR
jgi:hypothetical protein